MPDSASIKGEVFCPTCGEKAWDYVHCQWGVLPLSTYSIGDEVHWLRDDHGTIVSPFTLMQVGPRVLRWNCGDPQFKNVILFDIVTDWTGNEYQCPVCNAGFFGGVVLVRDGVFHQVLALRDGDVDRILGPYRVISSASDGCSTQEWIPPICQPIALRQLSIVPSRRRASRSYKSSLGVAARRISEIGPSKRHWAPSYTSSAKAETSLLPQG